MEETQKTLKSLQLRTTVHMESVQYKLGKCCQLLSQPGQREELVDLTPVSNSQSE